MEAGGHAGLPNRQEKFSDLRSGCWPGEVTVNKENRIPGKESEVGFR